MSLPLRNPIRSGGRRPQNGERPGSTWRVDPLIPWRQPTWLHHWTWYQATKEPRPLVSVCGLFSWQIGSTYNLFTHLACRVDNLVRKPYWSLERSTPTTPTNARQSDEFRREISTFQRLTRPFQTSVQPPISLCELVFHVAVRPWQHVPTITL